MLRAGNLNLEVVWSLLKTPRAAYEGNKKLFIDRGAGNTVVCRVVRQHLSLTFLTQVSTNTMMKLYNRNSGQVSAAAVLPI